MQDWIFSIILYPLIYIFPSYVANGAPVIFGGGRPIDNGRRIGGKPIFGPHKTVRGLAAGIASGAVIGAIESVYLPYMLVIGIAMSIGTHAGDLIGSFLKRRIGRSSGESVFLLDQYSFLVFALLFALPFGNIPEAYGILFIIILTGILHKGTNVIAHALKLKHVPW